MVSSSSIQRPTETRHFWIPVSGKRCETPETLNPEPNLDPKEPTALDASGLLVMISLYESLKGGLFWDRECHEELGLGYRFEI